MLRIIGPGAIKRKRKSEKKGRKKGKDESNESLWKFIDASLLFWLYREMYYLKLRIFPKKAKSPILEKLYTLKGGDKECRSMLNV